jgi:two-component system copper resistance phosphate regulon response regulator CusR
MRILVAEQDQALGIFLERSFDAEHYAVDIAANGEAAKAMADAQEYDAAIFDLNLGETNGTDVLRYVRSRRETLPILVLSNRTRPEDRVQALDLGADDLVVKPFAFSELSARVRAMLRRGGHAADTVLHVGDLELNRVERSVSRGARRIELTPKEFGLLEYLMRNTGQRVTRTQIIQHVWNLSFDTIQGLITAVQNNSGIAAASVALGTASSTFDAQRVNYGTALTQLQATSNFLGSEQTELSTQENTIDAADIAQATTAFSQATVAYESLIKAESNILNLPNLLTELQ